MPDLPKGVGGSKEMLLAKRGRADCLIQTTERFEIEPQQAARLGKNEVAPENVWTDFNFSSGEQPSGSRSFVRASFWLV